MAEIKEAKILNSFSSKHGFGILDFKRIHSHLLIRGRSNSINIDLIFVGVEFISIPMSFKGVDISIENKRIADFWGILGENFLLHPRENLFNLKTDTNPLGVIIASQLYIHENKLNPLDSYLDYYITDDTEKNKFYWDNLAVSFARVESNE